MTHFRAVLLASVLLPFSPLALGQSTPPPQAEPPFGHRPMGPDGPGMGHLGMLPHGTWWKDPAVISSLNLTADQQKRLDDTFQQTRPQLTQLKAALDEEQARLQPMLNATELDQAGTYAEISKIADLRASLEKTHARMLLGMRAVLTPDQWSKLQANRAAHREGGPNGFRGRRSPDGPPAN